MSTDVLEFGNDDPVQLGNILLEEIAVIAIFKPFSFLYGKKYTKIWVDVNQTSCFFLCVHQNPFEIGGVILNKPLS